MGYLHFVFLGLYILSAFAADADQKPKPPFIEGNVRFIKPSKYILPEQVHCIISYFIECFLTVKL
jgi:hypothetical protein